MGGAKERDDIRWLIQLTLAFVYLHQGWTCGLGPRSDFDKTRAGNRAYHAYGQYNLNDDEWSAQDSTGINTDAWSHVTYADDAANNIVAGQWDRGTNNEPDHLWATPILYTHPDVYYSDYVFHMRNYFPYGTIGPNERKIATLRGKQPIWNAAVVKLFYFCAYDPAATDATPRDAELRIDLFYPGSGTRRTIWKVEDQQKILPPVRPAVESSASCDSRTSCNVAEAVSRLCHQCPSVSHWKYAAIRIPVSAEPYQIEITGLDGNTGDVAFDLVSFETFEVCAPTWVPYFGVINDVKTSQTTDSIETCAKKCLRRASCDLFGFNYDSGRCDMRQKSTKETSANPNDMCWPSEHPRTTTYELNCLGPAATYDFLLDSDGDYFQGAWRWHNCIDNGTCTDFENLGERIRLDPTDRLHKPAITEGFGYFFSAATLKAQTPFRRDQDVHVIHTLPAAYLEAFKPHGTMHAWCSNEGSTTASFTMQLFTLSDTNAETKVAEAAADCTDQEIRRLFYEPFVVDGTFARLRVRELLRTTATSDYDSNAAVTGQRLMIDVPLGIGCFSGLPPPADAQDVDTNDVPTCLVRCHGLGKPVAALRGASCACLDQMPYASLRPSRSCHTPCYGERWMCGGQDEHSFYTASCPDGWQRVGHFCYKKFADAAADTARKAHALCTMNNAELFNPRWSYDYNMASKLLVSDGASAFLGFKIIRNPATVYTFSGELMTDFEEIKSLTKLGADADCVEVARSGTTLTASGACTASAEVICQQPLVRGWGTQEIAETDDLVMRTASSGSDVFADPSQWWSPAADDTSPRLVWEFSRQVMVSGFKISSKSDKLMESFFLKYKEDYLSNDTERFYATSEAGDIYEFNITSGLQLSGEFTAHIHLAYPKVSNWFALLPSRYVAGAEVKVTLLGSTASESVTVSERPGVAGSAALNLTEICRDADHSDLEGEGFQLMNAEPELWPGHSSLIHAYKKVPEMAYQICQPRTQCRRTGDGNVLCTPYRAMWYTRKASRTCAAGFHNVVGHCVTPSAQALSQEAGAEACSSVPGVPIEFNSAAEFTLFRLMMVTHQMNESIYIGVRRSGDGFVNGAGEPLPPATQFHRIWAPNEPASTGDCVILDPEVDFFARTVDCSTPHPTYCQPRAPRNCPADFEYQGDSYSCFHFHVDTSRVWDHTAASEYCRHKGTSLAVPRDQQQLDFIKDLVDRVITKAVDAGGSDTEHTGALGAVLLNDDGDDPNITVTINNISPQPTKTSWNLLKESMSSSKSCAYTVQGSDIEPKACIGSGSHINYPVCQYHACYALNSSAECVFPFRYKGRVYGHCTRLDSDDGSAWCPTQLVNGEASRTNGSFATCLDSCPVRQCPVGFLEIAAPPRSAPICLLLSSYRDEEVLIPPRTPGQQRDFCERLGSRPLTLESPFHYELIKNNVSKVFPEFKQYVAFGGYYWNAADPHLILDSGRRPSPRVLELVKSSFDDALLGTYNTTCVVMKGDTFQNVPCDVGMAYHACEANVEYTESGPAGGQLCQFPFTYAGRNYSSCAENTDRGQAWCATVVTGDGLVDGDNWGYCPPGDERTVAGPASPERCQFPFIAGGVRYERCTKVTGLTTPDTGGRFWCSTANDAAGVMTRPDAWGECHENIWPPDNPYCNVPFEGNGEGKCAYLHHEKITDDTEAAGVCSNINAELAIPFSKEHQEVLDEFIQEKDKTYFPNFDYIRTSGYKSNGQWFWKGALDIGFFNWAAAGEAAKEGCVFIDTTVGPPYRWVVLACDTPAYTVCRAACADGQITFNGRCLEVSTTTVTVSVLAEAACHDKGQRLFTPSSDAELRQLQGVMAAQYPGKLPAIIGLTECRFSFADLWRRSRADRQVPRTVDGKLARWAIPGTNYQYDQPFPCLDETSQGLYFTLEPPSAPQPMTAYANTKSLSLNYICAPDLTDPCPEGYHPLDDQCIKVSDTTATYHEAQAACHEDNADLLYIKYFHERYTVPLLVKALNSAQLTRQFVWIGYDRIDDPTFTNIWGEPGSFKQGWLKNGPGTTPQDCVILQKDTSWLGGYVFNVRDCNERHHYACTYRGQQRKNICPEEFPFYYQGDCFRVSNSSLTFAQAEVECSLSTSGYSKLAAPQASHVSMFGYLAARFDDLWVGLDDRAGGLTNSGGDPVLPATVARLPTPDASSRRRRSTGQCMAIRDGGYQLTDCQERRRHVCLLVRSPSCPDRFIRHQDNCYLVPNQRPRGEDYATAERKCALTGSFVAADRDARQADFLKALWTAVNHTSYWVGLSSDEKDETSLFYPNWEPFTSGNYSRFDAPPSMAAPACTVVASDDGFATWRESSCVQRANIICHYQGLPTCPAGYTALLDSGYTCLRHSPDNGTYWSKFSECYNDGPNTGLAVVSSGRVQAAMMSFVEKESNAASTAPFWISFRGPSALVDEPEHQNRPVGNVVQRVRWIDYNAMTWTDEVTELHNNGTNMTEIWRDKCATLDLESNWLRNDCLDNFAALCEHTACYSTRGHQCIFPFLGPEDGVEYHNCTSLDTTNIFQPYCATEVNSTGHAVRIEKCQRYCYFRRPVVKCYDPPLHPLLENETDPTVWRANWTSSWDGVTHLKQYQNITYQCPIGYVFDKNNKNIIKLTCGNWTWEPEPGLSNATCQPVQCSRELPNVPADTSPGNASVLVWDGLYEYLTPIEFTCPTGHVFEGLVRKAHEGNWSINPSPWSQLTSVECDATGQWMPAFLPNCVPFDCLGPPLEPPEWVSYDWDNATISYGHTVRYWCTPGVGWAFPSDGAIEHFSTCQENGNWSLTELEDCILMPCPDPAPETVTNQTFSYGLVFSNYTCPPAWEFADGSRQKSAECLLETKVWEPAVMPPCQKRRCAEEPPEVFQKGMTRKWPKGEDGQPNYELDVVIQYRCPHRRLTWEFNETIQEVMCIHDPESDLMVWEPFNITLCNRTIPYDGIVLPPPPPVDVRYPVTTDYYWGTIEHNTSVVPAGGGFDLGNGPFGFRSSITLPGDSCMRHASFMREGDTCVHDPSTCANGISFSLWHRCSFDSDAFTPREGLPYRYLVSTGGDEASPGIAIYLQGMVLGALVSTGNKFWRVETIGLLPNNTWNNIGVRWRPPAQNGSEQEFTGLQLYINQQPAAMVIHGQTPNTTAQPPLDPPEFMVGCHKTSADSDYSHFCPCEFDEIALWKRALLTNETIFFIGGLEEDYAGMSAEVFADILRGVDLTDPDQQSVAVSIASKMVDNPEKSIDNPLSSLKRPEQEEEDEEEEEGEEEEDEDAKAALRLATQGQISKMHVLADLLFTMTAPEVVKPNQTEQELNTFMNLVNLASQLLENKHHNKWKGIELQNNKKEREQKILKEEVQLDGESSDMIDRLEMYALSSVTSMVPKVVNGSLVDMFVHKPSANVDMYIEQRSVDSLRQEQMAPLPSDNPRRLDSIQMPTVVFRKSGCEDALISTVFSTYDNYGDVTPKRFLRREFKTKQAQYLDIDGAVLSLRLMATRNQQPTDECLPTIDDLRRSPVRTAHRHRQPKPALRGPLFHENEIVSDVFRRHCVWWNADALDGRGQWDATGCVVLETNDFFTKCACKVIGQYAVVAEKDEPKIVEIDSEWLKLFKDMLSAISIILLLLYAFIVWKNDSLWEMFHQIRMVTALLLVAGHCAMMESDRETVRQSRHSCTTAAAFIQFAYLAAGGMVASEGYACFRALAFGVVGGKLGSYVALSFGLSLVSLGYALGTEIHRYGDDPQCMMGWETDVKLIFLAPMALCVFISVIGSCIILCNMSTPQLRKQIMAIDHASMCHGYVFFSPYFAVTWAAGVLAYLRLEALDDWPSFYPLFRVLNAATGVVFFVCQGLLSHRFLSMLLCRRRQRQQLLLAYARHENEPEPVDDAEKPVLPEEEDAFSSSSDEEDEEARVGIAPIPETATEPTQPDAETPPSEQQEQTSPDTEQETAEGSSKPPSAAPEDAEDSPGAEVAGAEDQPPEPAQYTAPPSGGEQESDAAEPEGTSESTGDEIKNEE